MDLIDVQGYVAATRFSEFVLREISQTSQSFITVFILFLLNTYVHVDQG